MVQDYRRHLFFNVTLRPISIIHFKTKVMKKIFLLIAMMGVLMGAISCSDNDEPKRGDGVFTVNTPMINHMYNTTTGTVMGISNTHNKLTLDTVKHIASLELNYKDGSGDKTLSISNITARPKRLGFYELSATGNGQFKDFKGYVDFNEGSMRYIYTTADGIRVISTLPEVFFLKSKSTITYDDTTKTTVMDGAMYQFELRPASSSVLIKVMGIVHAKDLKYFINLTGNGAELTPTANGYLVQGENIRTSGVYRNWVDSTSSVISTTDKYPFKTFHADIDLVNDSLKATFMMGGSATVVATGTTYPDYTAY